MPVRANTHLRKITHKDGSSMGCDRPDERRLYLLIRSTHLRRIPHKDRSSMMCDRPDERRLYLLVRPG